MFSQKGRVNEIILKKTSERMVNIGLRTHCENKVGEPFAMLRMLVITINFGEASLEA